MSFNFSSWRGENDGEGDATRQSKERARAAARGGGYLKVVGLGAIAECAEDEVHEILVRLAYLQVGHVLPLHREVQIPLALPSRGLREALAPVQGGADRVILRDTEAHKIGPGPGQHVDGKGQALPKQGVGLRFLAGQNECNVARKHDANPTPRRPVGQHHGADQVRAAGMSPGAPLQHPQNHFVAEERTERALTPNCNCCRFWLREIQNEVLRV